MGRWCDQRQLSPGAVISLRQCWELAVRWYPGRDRIDWIRPTTEEVRDIFRAVGLTGPFWAVR